MNFDKLKEKIQSLIDSGKIKSEKDLLNMRIDKLCKYGICVKEFLCYHCYRDHNECKECCKVK